MRACAAKRRQSLTRYNPYPAVTVPFNYRPQRSCGKVMFSQTCVKNSVHGGHLRPSMHPRSHDHRVSVPGGLSPVGGLCLGVSRGSLPRGYISGGLC